MARAITRSTVILAVLCLAAPPAARADDAREGERKVADVIAKVKEKDPRMPKAFEEAYGYAVFPSVGKGGLGLGGAHGKGRVYERGKLVGRSSLIQLTIGLQLGGQAYSEVVFFKTKAAFADFKRGKLKLDAQATAIALDARAAADLAYRDGVAIVTIAKGGLMYEASIGGQKFSFKALEEVEP
jgi:lipid-binding SYLF domain-containing protein